MEGGAGGGGEYPMKVHNKWKHSELWWLTPEDTLKYKYIYVCYQEPYSDEPNSERAPYSVPRFFSVDERGNLSRLKKYYPLEYINDWRIKFENINVFRSFGLSSSEHGIDKLFGPFIIDIDREEGGFYEGYVQNLDKALKDTCRLADEYLHKFKENAFRIFFTGHKGFNIEILPSALGLVAVECTKERFKRIRDNINDIFNDKEAAKFADKVHDEIRLYNSINRWMDKSGKIINRMKFELSIQELKNLSIDEICRKSEMLASNYILRKKAVQEGRKPLFFFSSFPMGRTKGVR